MFLFLIAFIIIIFLIVFFIMFVYWVWWGAKSAYCDSNGYINFKSFVSFYNINPDRWELHDDYIKFILNNDPEEYFPDLHRPDLVLYCSFGDRRDRYCFRIIDYYRYKLWRRKKEKHAAQVESAQKIQEMTNILKQDIADYEKRNQKEVTEKLNEIWKEQ